VWVCVCRCVFSACVFCVCVGEHFEEAEVLLLLLVGWLAGTRGTKKVKKVFGGEID
jgi:hypothetical protein